MIRLALAVSVPLPERLPTCGTMVTKTDGLYYLQELEIRTYVINLATMGLTT